MADLASLPAPVRSFASDNSAGVHPEVMAALLAANDGHALAYGADDHTARLNERFREMFGVPCEVFLVWGGTGANLVALGTILPGAGAVICTESAHINVDECGAPERILGAKLLDLATPDGKLRVEQVEAQAHVLGVEHHVQPKAVSITQSTELGTLYTPEEVGELADVAHGLGLALHVDGARIANATVALGVDVRAPSRSTPVSTSSPSAARRTG